MWFVLNFVPPPGQRRSTLPDKIDAFNEALLRDDSSQQPLELFAPTFVALESDRGKVNKTEKPLLYHYIFVRGTENAIKRMCHTFEGFSFVMDRASDTRRHLTVSDATLSSFRILASYHSGKLPCYPLEGIDLQEGDRVQIVSGPCAGLTGTYISRKGAKSGNILVAIDGNMAAIMYDVKAEYVTVLEFARDSKRVYDQLDAFSSRLLASLPEDEGAPFIPSLKLTAAATVFTRRLGSVKLHNPKLDAKLQILLYGAYRVLSDTSAAREALQRFRTLEHHITNPKTITLCSKILRL